MFNLKNRIYISTFVNSFGSWLTFIAIALLTKEKYGAQHVALVFLIQTLPAIIFSRGLANLVPIGSIEKFYIGTQLLLALSSFLLILNQNLLAIYIFLFISSFLKSLSNPLNNTLIGKWTQPNDQKEVFTKVGALQAGTLALAPALGAWVKIFFSTNTLFLIDGITFLISILVLKELFIKLELKQYKMPSIEWKKLFAGISPKPGDIPIAVQKELIVWFLFLAVGALINALEFPAFQRAQMTETFIGYAMGAWGLGSLIAFLIKNPFSDRLSAVGLMTALAAFIFIPNPYVVLVSFILAGALTSYVSGSIRSQLQRSVPEGYAPAPVWAYANQITQIINLIAYGSIGLLLGLFGFYFFGIILVACTYYMISKIIRHKQNQIIS